jgi:hypothetical protein
MENLVKIQNELKVPKGNLNKFGNYKYRSAEDILEAVKPILLKYEVALIICDEIVSIGNKLFLKATAKLAMHDKAFNGDKVDHYCIKVDGYAELSEHKGMSAEQATGTASSYARKYALNGLFLIDETESDADSQKPAAPITQTNFEDAKSKLIVVSTLAELQSAYMALNPVEKANKEVIELKDKLKLTLK